MQWLQSAEVVTSFFQILRNRRQEFGALASNKQVPLVIVLSEARQFVVQVGGTMSDEGDKMAINHVLTCGINVMLSMRY